MKIVVTGAHGMLGQDLVPVLEDHGHEVRGYGRLELDVTSLDHVRAVLRRDRPELVVQCAAYTNVDGAEASPEEAFLINGHGTQTVALVCQELDVPMLYVSTDYVFDGEFERPYLEIDRPNPLSVYGQSKYAGELWVQQLLTRFYIVRTSWLYGRHGKNFVDTMRKLGRERPELGVVADQRGCPTWTVALSHAIAQLIETGRYGLYQITGQGVTTWHGFAEAVMALDGLTTPVKPLTTAELGRPAPRPANSVMANLNLKLAGVPLLPAWQESLESYMSLVPFEAVKR